MSHNAPRDGGRDPHDVLGVSRGADRQQVMRAFHRKARSGGHPDTGGDARTFDEIVQARDALLNRPDSTPYGFRQHTSRVTTMPKAEPRSAPPPPRAEPPSTYSPPKETSKLAIATGVLVLLGPLFWPLAIVVGHFALRQINRTGKGGGTFVPVVLLFLYLITLPVLVRILSVLFVP